MGNAEISGSMANLEV